MDIVKLKDFDRIYAVDVFRKEYEQLFGKSRNEYIKCLKKLRTNLKILDKEMKNSLQYQQFEKLSGSDLYSIRHVGEKNPRVIFAFVSDNYVLLLSSCKEKDKRDYMNALETANRRLLQLEGRK